MNIHISLNITNNTNFKRFVCSINSDKNRVIKYTKLSEYVYNVHTIVLHVPVKMVSVQSIISNRECLITGKQTLHYIQRHYERHLIWLLCSYNTSSHSYCLS